MKAKHVTFPSTGNYYTLGKGENLLYVLHGYGQLARFFIKKFEALQDRYTIVAPEGLHRFYLQGTSGRVGASWMTIEERETDIDNYLNFLNSLHQQISEGKNWESTSILGFSQGVATAFRWLANNAIQANTFLLCSGMIPPDVNLQESHHIFSQIKMAYFSGKNDPYRTEEAVKTFQERLNQLPYPIQKIEFEGKHEVHLPSILKFLETKV
jgi:predicted esterase